MIKGKGGVVRCPFSVKLCSRITVFSKQMLKNQVLEIFWKKYLVVWKKGFTFASSNNKNNSNNKKI